MKPIILIFTDWYLPGFKAGGPIKSISGMVSELSNDFKFIIITSDRDFGSSTAYDCKINEWIIDERGNELIYLSPETIRFNKLRELILEKNPDLIYLNSFFSFSFSIVPLLILFLRKELPKVILAPRGMLGTGALKLKRIKKQLFISVYKFLLLDRKISWHVTSLEEANEVKNVFGNVNLFLAPNISLSAKVNGVVPVKNVNELKVFYLSRISPKKNLIYALEVFNRLTYKLNSDAKIHFDIFGPIEDKNYWEECQSLISSIKTTSIQINYTGEVQPSKLSEIIQPYHLFFLPTLNENFGHVIVEAMSNGKPVLLSDQTPWKNLDAAGAGWEIALNDLNSFEEKIISMLAIDQETFTNKSKNAIKYCREKNNLEEVVNQTKKMFLQHIK